MQVLRIREFFFFLKKIVLCIYWKELLFALSKYLPNFSYFWSSLSSNIQYCYRLAHVLSFVKTNHVSLTLTLDYLTPIFQRTVENQKNEGSCTYQMFHRNKEDKNCHDEVLVLNTQKGDAKNTKCANEPDYEGIVITSS